MKVTGLDGRQYSVPLRPYLPDDRDRSSGHLEARGLLASLFPFDRFYEEVPALGCGVPLYWDFFSPSLKLLAEVQGRQHRSFVPWFHHTPEGFRAQLRRDALKREWAAANDFALCCLDDDRRADWADALRQAVYGRGRAGPVRAEGGGSA